jgi:hypothetical protein
MTDLFLATLVICTVIIFGVLISAGNERQRRAIVALHQAYKQWAVQDLRLKRGTISSQTQIEDVTAWFTKETSLALGRKTMILDYQLHNTPVVTVEMHDAAVGATIVCVLESPEVLMPILRKKRSILGREIHSNPLFRVGKKTPAVELSMLNAGKLFDIELPIAWSALTGQVTESNTLWVYILN